MNKTTSVDLLRVSLMRSGVEVDRVRSTAVSS
jgi:hypothetical protein